MARIARTCGSTGVGLAAHPAAGLEAVEQTPERRALHLQQVGELRLGDSLVAEEVGEHPPLRPRQPHGLHPPVEGDAQQACHVVDEEAEVAFEVFVQHGVNIVALLIINKTYS
jgi:hypothetical protein